jgi:hypothetical protein
VSIPFDAIRDAGAYICDWDGQLMRIWAGALSAASPAINIVGREPLTVTKISDDPDVPLVRARDLAAQFGVTAGF